MKSRSTAWLVAVLALAGTTVGAVQPGSAGADAGASLSFSTREEFHPNGYLRILVLKGGSWQEAAQLAMDEHLRTRTVDLSSWLSGSGLALRLEPIGPGASHLDAVNVGGVSALGVDERLGRKLSAADNDVVDFAEVAGLDLAFAPGRGSRVSITARMEPAVIGTDPAAYPVDNLYRPASAFRSFYRYRVGSRPWTLRIDGSLESESLGTPLFRENLPLGSGHPESPTWAWVGDDGRNLYALVDFTADNTLDGGKDYARLHVKTADGVRTFGVTADDSRWGRAGFEYTDRVGWEHKVYEIAVPLSEIGGIAGADVDLAFTLYGTASVIAIDFDTDLNGVDPDSGPSKTTFTFTVNYTDTTAAGAPQRHDLWIDVNQNGMQDAGTSVFWNGSGAGPWIVGVVLAGCAALMVALRRRSLARLLAFGIAMLALGTCKLPVTTQELYPMSGAGTNWSAGVVYTAEVQLVTEPGDYLFSFVFEDGLGNPVGGGAAGPLTVTVE